MYNVNDKSSAIRELQRFLLLISQNYSIPHLSVDGIFSEETRTAVEEFQRQNSLPVTGIAERETFDLAYKKYKEELLRLAMSTNKDFPLKIGDSGNNVTELNNLINELSFYYRDLAKVYGDFYSKDTENSVKLLQQYFLQIPSGTVNALFIERLKNELKERQKFEKD